MKKLSYLAMFATATLAACSPATNINTFNIDGKYITRPFTLDKKFHAISTISTIDMEYRQGEPKIEIYAPETVMDHISLTVKNGTLVASFIENNVSFSGECKIVVRVTAPDVNTFQTTGSGDITIYDFKSDGKMRCVTAGIGDIKGYNVTAGECRLNTDGTGAIIMEHLTADKLDATTNGTGDVIIREGKCVSALYSTNGTGDIKAGHFKVDHLSAYTNGTGNIICNAVKTIKSEIRGTGDISYKGIKP